MAELTAFIGVKTMGDFSPNKSKKKYQPMVRGWRYEIRHLMHDFGFSKEICNDVIRETERESNPGTSDEALYDKAWRKFWALLNC